MKERSLTEKQVFALKAVAAGRVRSLFPEKLGWWVGDHPNRTDVTGQIKALRLRKFIKPLFPERTEWQFRPKPAIGWEITEAGRQYADRDPRF